jgi:hypothetical protein
MNIYYVEAASGHSGDRGWKPLPRNTSNLHYISPTGSGTYHTATLPRGLFTEPAPLNAPPKILQKMAKSFRVASSILKN